MAVIVTAAKPAELLTAIKKQIADKKITTWAEESGFLTHSAAQWNRKAWFKPAVSATSLTFNLLKPTSKTTNTSVSPEVYAIYHGRLIEMLLAHFNKSLTSVVPTPLPAPGDGL